MRAGIHDDANSRGLVWDLPIRLSHWSLVLLMTLSWYTAEFRLLQWHRLAGYSILALLLFRLFWGFAGSTTARFGHFLRGPRVVWAYVRERTRDSGVAVGHNPLGGWSVMAVLAAMLLQALLGLFAVDVDGLESGPLSHWVSFDAGRQAAALHEFVFNLLLGWIGLHLAALLYYRLFRGERLVRAMVSGRGDWQGREPPRLRFVSSWAALIWFAFAAALVALLVLVLGR